MDTTRAHKGTNVAGDLDESSAMALHIKGGMGLFHGHDYRAGLESRHHHNNRESS